jgi:arylsulfatase A-like enzyme
VLVIAIDGLRADHVGCYGHDRPTTPTLDALFADGVRFQEAFATAPTLLPSHVSLFTGCDPNVARRTQLLNEMEASVD